MLGTCSTKLSKINYVDPQYLVKIEKKKCFMATPTGGEAARARAAKPPRVGLFRQHASCHSEVRKSFWDKI